MKNFDTRKTQSQGEGGDRATGSSGRRAPMIGQDLIEMTEGPVKPAVNGSFRLDTPVEALASHALQSIVKIRSKGSEARAQLVDRLLRASRNVDASDAHSLIDNLMGEGVELGEMIDYYIPEVARRLGQAWCDDLMSFAEVSMASARLQSMARLLSDRHPDEANHRGGAILLIVTAREQHTLGAVVLSVWLKRNRVPHRLVIAPDEREIARVLTSDAFEGVFIFHLLEINHRLPAGPLQRIC